MLKYGSRKNYISVIILIAVMLFLFSSYVTTEASLRPLNLNELMEKSLLSFRKVDVNGIVFDVYINQKEKSITVRGEVESWKEKEMAEKYFRLRAPSDFYLNYEISVLY
ncbi:MAG: hypothetical protein ACMUHX_07275 [bacterium]